MRFILLNHEVHKIYERLIDYKYINVHYNKINKVFSEDDCIKCINHKSTSFWKH